MTIFSSTKFIFSAVLIAFLIPFSTLAAPLFAEEVVEVRSSQIIEDNFIRYGSVVNIMGDMEKDVIVGGGDITITGPVGGDVIALGSNITITGDIEGNVRAVGENIRIEGSVGKNVMVFGSDIIFTENADIGWNVFVMGENITHKGAAQGKISGNIVHAVFGGSIANDVHLTVVEDGSITVLPEAHLGGSLRYIASRESVNLQEGAIVIGTVEHTRLSEDGISFGNIAFTAYILLHLMSLFGMLVVGMVFLVIAKPFMNKTAAIAQKKFGEATWWGFVALVMTPIVIVLLILTLIGIPLAFLLLAAWLVSLYISKLVVAYAIGQKVLRSPKATPYWQFIGGVLLVALVTSIPVVGWVIKLFIVLVGLGSIWLYLRTLTDHKQPITHNK